MIRFCFTFVAVAIFGLTVAAQEPEKNWKELVIPSKERTFDFKTVPRGSVPEYQFILHNPLQETLHIGGITASCTCTTLHFDEEKTVLETYDGLAVTVRLRGDMFEGQRNSTITVSIDKPIRTEIQLNVRGEIRSDLNIDPRDLLDFGNVEIEKGQTRTLTVTYTGVNTQWRLVDTRCENKFIRADITREPAHVGSQIFRVNVSVDKSAPHGIINTHLILISNDAESRREIPVPVRATVGTVINVRPPALSLGIFPPGESSPTKTAILSGTRPFRITKIECDNPAVDIVMNGLGRDTLSRIYPLAISYRNPAEGEGAPENGIIRAAVRITTDVPDLAATFYVTATIREKENEE